MKKSVSLGFLFVMLSAFGFAQDLGQVKNDIDAERFDTAKKTLKTLIKSNPDNGKLFFYLGDVYLAQKESDSALAVFNKGLLAKDKGFLSNIGLAQLDLDAKKNADAVAKTIVAAAVATYTAGITARPRHHRRCCGAVFGVVSRGDTKHR